MLAAAIGIWQARRDFETGPSGGGPTLLGLESVAPAAADYILEHDLPQPILNYRPGDLALRRLYEAAVLRAEQN